MLTVIRLGLPDELRRSLGCTNAIESLIAVLRQVCRNVKRWRDARMALRWTATAMLEAEKSFRRLKAPQAASDSEAPGAAQSAKSCSMTNPLAAKIWQHRIQPMAPAAPISTGNGTIRHNSVQDITTIVTKDNRRQTMLKLLKESINHPNSISVIPANTKKFSLVLVLGRASDLAWPWEKEERFKSLYIELEAKLQPGHDPLKQDLVLTLARLIWIQQELMPKNGAEANEEILKVLQVSTAQLTQEIVKEFAMRDLARLSK